MRFTKLLSVFLAALMLFSCVAGALATGVFAEESGEGEETVFTPHYTDPRDGVDESLITTYYAGVVEGQTTFASSFQGFAKLAKETWPAGSVLVIKTNCNLYMASDTTSTSIPRVQGLFGGWRTMFREDGTKLPIVIEGLKEDKAIEIRLDTKTGFANWQFANDMYFTNVTVKAYNITDNINIYAGAGLVTFHDCNIEYSQYINFYGDTYSADAWYGWNDSNNSHRDANINSESGLIETGFIFGKGTSFINAEGTATVVPQIAATNNIGHYSNYKPTETFPANGTAITDDLLTAYNTGKNGTRFYYGSTNQVAKDYNSARYMPRPYNVKVNIMIDNGLTDGTLDFANVVGLNGTQPVGATEISIYSGDVLSLWTDKGTDAYASGRDASLKMSTKEFYNGDITVNIASNVGTVIGVTDATLVGDFTLNVTGGEITKITAAYSTEGRTVITGNYVANISGGTIGYYQGGIATYGDNGTVTNNISGGTFNTQFFGARYACDNVINNITGGTFNCAVYGANNGKSNLYVGGTIVNTIGAESINDLYLGSYYYPGNINADGGNWASITTTINGSGNFGGFPAANGTTTSLTIESTSADDVLQFRTATYNFDSVEMNGGEIVFAASASFSFTAQAATGSASIRNYTEFADDSVKFTFVGAEDTFELTPTFTKKEDITTMPKVVFNNGDITVVKTNAPVLPVGGQLIPDDQETRIAIRFAFDKEIKDFEITLNGNVVNKADVVKSGDFWFVDVEGIGLADYTTKLSATGDVALYGDYDTLKEIVTASIEQWEGEFVEWANWSKALANLKGGNYTVEGVDETKEYTPYSVIKGALQGDVSGVKVEFTLSDITGVNFVTTFNTMPTDLVVTVNGKDLTNLAVTGEGTVSIGLCFAAQNMEKTIEVKVANGTDLYYTFSGIPAQLAQAAGQTAFLTYIQAAAALANA